MQNRYSKLIVAVFLLLQFLILFVFGYTPYPDCEGYMAAASEALAQGSPYPSVRQLVDLEFVWNLGAINAVELSLWLTGSILPLLVVYTLLKGLTAWLVYLIMRHLSGPRVAMAALLIYVCYPANYGESTSLLSELPFVFFILLAVYEALVARRLLLGGMLMAVANWFRPMGLVFLLALVLLLVWLVWYGKGKENNGLIYKKYAPALPIVGYVAMLLVIATATRCYCGRFIYQAETGWMGLMQYSWDHDTDQTSDLYLFEQGDPMYVGEAAEVDGTVRDSRWRAHFVRWLRHGNVGEYIRQWPKKVVMTFVSDNTTFCTFVPEKRQQDYMYDMVSLPTLARSFPRLQAVQWLAVVNLLFYYALLLFYVGSLWLLRRRPWQAVDVLTLAIVALGTAVLMLAGHGESRFHQPFMPFIIMTVAQAAVVSLRKQ